MGKRCRQGSSESRPPLLQRWTRIRLKRQPATSRSISKPPRNSRACRITARSSNGSTTGASSHSRRRSAARGKLARTLSTSATNKRQTDVTSTLLTKEEVVEMTNRVQQAAQTRELSLMGVGSVLVLRAHVEQLLDIGRAQSAKAARTRTELGGGDYSRQPAAWK